MEEYCLTPTASPRYRTPPEPAGLAAPSISHDVEIPHLNPWFLGGV